MTKNLEGWDYIKHLLALAHCGRNFSRPGTVRCYNDDIENRKMIIAFMKDYYGFYSTIFVSLSGSPPKAYAILQVCETELNDWFKRIYSSYSPIMR